MQSFGASRLLAHGVVESEHALLRRETRRFAGLREDLPDPFDPPHVLIRAQAAAAG
jgi:hypothetical protein